MFDDRLLIICVLRLSLLLVVGWTLLASLRRRHPLWSVWITRSMAAACVVVPMTGFVSPGVDLALLPAPTRSAGSQLSDAGNTPLSSSQSTQPTPVDSRREFERNSVASTVELEAEPAQVTLAQGPRALARDPASAPKPLDAVERGIFDDLPVRWMAGALWVLISLGVIVGVVRQLLSARRLFAKSRPLSTAESERVRRLDVRPERNRATVLVTDEFDCPCTGGIFRPAIFIPGSWLEERTDGQLRAILAHEQSHVDGRDLAWNLLCRVAFALWWLHPLVWFLGRRHRLACEFVADATAGESVNDAPLYRRWLAQWTIDRRHVTCPLSSLTAGTLAMANQPMMLRRLAWLKQGNCPRRPSRLQVASLLLLAISVGSAVSLVNITRSVSAAQPEQPARPDAVVNDPEVDRQVTTRRIIVRVVNQEGEPIKGASVALGRWEFPDKRVEMLSIDNPLTTDEDGEVSFDASKDAVKTIIRVTADDYAEASQYVAIAERLRVVLERGRRIRVRVVDENRNAVPSAIPIVENGQRWPNEFEPVADSPGTFLSPVIVAGRNAMYVVDKTEGVDGESHFRFSDWIDLSGPTEQDADGTVVATVRPGVRLRGRLDDSVPRPIEFGFVELCVAESLRYNNLLKVGSRWRDRVAIEADGTFEFAGVPFGSHAQIYATADGYQSSPPTDQELVRSLKDAGADDEDISQQMSQLRRAYLPRLVAIDSKTIVEIDQPIPCQVTASVDVKVVDPSGADINNAVVSFNPNGRFFGADLFIAGTDTSLDSDRFHGGLLRSDPTHLGSRCWKWASESFVSVATDDLGVAKIRHLPTGFREGYKVRAPGYVMPVHPTTLKLNVDLSALDRDSPHRYAAVDLVSGETLQRTVTLERYVKRGMRELNVLTDDGKAVAGVNVTVAELTFQDSPDEWLAWSVSRLGAMATAESNDGGLIRLEVPLEAEGRIVDRLRVAVSGNVQGVGFLQRQYLELPIVSDGRVLRLSEKADAPGRRGASTYLRADLVRSSDVFSASRQNLLRQLVESPSLALLVQLLRENDFDAVTPLKFRSDRNLLGPHGLPKRNNDDDPANTDGAVAEVSTAHGRRVVVLCDVRPKGSSWKLRPWSGHPPEAAFVFRTETGELIRMIGGGFSASENTSSVMLLNMGGTDDHFVETQFFEEHSPFEMLAQWFHLGREEESALTTYNHANATSWPGKEGVADPPGEYGFTGYGFNGQNIDYWLPGKTPAGLLVPRKIYWNAADDTFSGPVTQSFDGKLLYRVVESASSAFKPFSPKSGSLIIAGGRTEHPTEFQWDVVVPDGTSASLKVDEFDAADSDTPSKSLAAYPLAAGLNTLQIFMMQPKGDASQSEMRVFLNYRSGKAPDKLLLPKVAASRSASAKPWSAIRSAADAVDLVFYQFDTRAGRVRVRVVLD